MAVDVSLWAEVFNGEVFPAFPCPECKHGSLSLQKSSLKVMEPKYSKDARQADAWEPDWMVHRFTSIMECSNPSCGELVVVSGVTKVVEFYDDDDFGHGFSNDLTPKAMIPAPPIIKMAISVPAAVAEQVRKSFGLYWNDLSACANRIRTALERILDDKGIKKFNKKGKRLPISLSARIALFEKKYGNDYTDVFTALRQIGNLGSHSDVSRTSVLAAYELFDHVLVQIYESPAKKIAKLAKRIKKKKGKLK